jgi:hypothetical protein
VQVKWNGKHETVFAKCPRNTTSERVLMIPLAKFPELEGSEPRTLLRHLKLNELRRSENPEWDFECVPLVDLDELHAQGVV